MTGETPEDIEARRVANEAVIRDAIAAAFRKPIPSVVPRDLPPKMSENGGILAANARMDRIEHSVEVLAGEVNKVADLVGKVSEKVDQRFNESNNRADEKAAQLVNASKTDFSKFSTPITLVATVILFLIGGFATYVETGVNNDFGRVEKSISTLMDVLAKRADKVDDRFQRFEADTVPRREADNRFERDEQAITNKVNKDVFSKTTEYRDDQIATLRADVKSMLENSVKRSDLDARFQDFTKRMDLISNRVEALQVSSAGTAILNEQIKELQESIRELRARLLNAAK